jgi:hypothetical protein
LTGTRRLVRSPYAASLALTLLFYSPLLLPGGHFWMGDYQHFFVPVRGYATRALQRGVLPEWSDALFAGFPFLSDPQSAVFFPLNLLFALVARDPGAGSVDMLTLATVLLLAAGGVFLARAFSLSCPASVAASCVIALNGFVVTHLGQTAIVQSLCAGVWALGAVARAVRRESLDWAVAAGLLCACVALAGHPHMGVLAAYAAAAGGLLLAAGRLRARPATGAAWRMAGIACVILCVAAAGSLVQILPTLSLLRVGGRHFGEVTDSAAMACPLALKQAWGLLLPGLYRPLTWRLPPSDRHMVDYAMGGEGIYEVGVGACALALFGWLANIRRPLAGFLAAAVVLLFLASLGRDGGVYPVMFRCVPGFGSLRFPMRMLMPAHIAIALLAGLGIDAARGAPSRNLRRTALVAMAAVFAVAITGAAFLSGARLHHASWEAACNALFVEGCAFQSWARRAPGTVGPCVADQLAVGAAVTAAVMVWFAAAARPGSPGRSTALGVLAALLVFAELGVYGLHRNIRTGPREYDVFDYPVFRDLPEGGKGRVLVCDAPGSVAVDSALLTGVEYAGGYQAILLDSVAQFVPPRESVAGPETDRLRDLFCVSCVLTPRAAADGGDNRAKMHTRAFWRAQVRPAPEYARLVPAAETVRYGKAAAEVRARFLSDEFDPRRTVLVDARHAEAEYLTTFNADIPSSHTGTASALERRDHLETLGVSASARGWLVLSQAYHAGWHAKVDGGTVPIVRANGPMCALPVPEGSHRVELRFRTPGLVVGGGVSVTAWLVCGAFLARRLFGRCKGGGSVLKRHDPAATVSGHDRHACQDGRGGQGQNPSQDM